MGTRRRLEERMAEWLLRRLSSADEAWWIIDDLREAFADHCSADGERAARRWYRREVLASLFPLLSRRLDRRRRAAASHGAPMWQNLRGDLAYSLRLARRAPLGSAAIVLTMVLGIGATTAVFNVVNAVLLHSLPFPDADRTVRLTEAWKDNAGGSLAYPDLLDFRRDVAAFADVTGVAVTTRTFLGEGGPEELDVIRTDEAYPRVFGLHVAFGRYFTPSEMQSGAPRVVILSNGLWQRAFGGDRKVVGRTISLDNDSYQVVGVLPPLDFLYPNAAADALIPLRVQTGTMYVNRGAMWIDGVAKLRAGTDDRAAAAQLTAVSRRLAEEYPNSNAELRAHLEPLRDEIVGPVRPMLRLLSLAMAAVLLLASLNVANLLLARAQARVREFAVRASLGGTASRIRRQVFSEGLLLSAIGGSFGLATAPALTRGLLALYPGGLPRAQEIGIDLSVLAIAAATTLLAGVLSVWPLARRVGRINLASAMRDDERGGRSCASRRGSRTLVVVQVAVSGTLLFAAALLVTTFLKLTRVDPGFDPTGTLTFRITPSSTRYPSAASVEQFYGDIASRLRAIPGVTAVASASQIPTGDAPFGDVFVRKDIGDQGAANPNAYVAAATPGFERALGMMLVRGRAFDRGDDSTAARVVVIDETLAERTWPGKDALGQLIDWNRETWRVVGILRSTRDRRPWSIPSPHMYAPAQQRFARARYVAIRSHLAPTQLIPAVRTAAAGVDPTAAVTSIETVSDQMRSALAEQRFRAWLVGALGALAIALSTIGIYSFVSYAVSQRTREIGIRIALGDTRSAVRARVVGEALSVAAAGTAIGVLLSLALGQWLSTFLYEVTSHNLPLLVSASGALLAIAIVAAYGPARRASNVDPLVALRGE